MTVTGAASLTAAPRLHAVATPATLDELWQAYSLLAQAASTAAWKWRMIRSSAGHAGQTGFLFQAAYEAENAADQAYTAWQAAFAAANPGARG